MCEKAQNKPFIFCEHLLSSGTAFYLVEPTAVQEESHVSLSDYHQPGGLTRSLRSLPEDLGQNKFRFQLNTRPGTDLHLM